MHRRFAFMLTLASAAGFALPAAATTFDVTTTADVADASPGDGKCASVQNSCSLRAAIQEADKSSFAITITLPAGTYALKLAAPDDAMAATGDLDVVGDVTITGAGADGTVVDGSGLQRVFHIVQSATVKISDLTVKNGLAKGGNGGGILNDGELRLSNVKVLANRSTGDPGVADGRGGGIENRGKLTLMGVSVGGNTADGKGGGVANWGFLDMMNSEVSGNSSLTDDGGGISSSGRATIALSTIGGNKAANGGGINNLEGEMRLVDSTLSANAASAAGGGVRNSGALSVVNTTLSGNAAAAGGGGISNYAKGKADLNNATVAENATAASGGGIASATPDGVTIANTLIAANRDGANNGPDCTGSLVSHGYNLVGNAAGCSLTGDATGNQTDKDAKLGPLAKGDGPTATRPLLTGSPAIDAANPAPPTATGGTCAAADQRGVKRPQVGVPNGKAICDIGAYELKLAQ